MISVLGCPNLVLEDVLAASSRPVKTAQQTIPRIIPATVHTVHMSKDGVGGGGSGGGGGGDNGGYSAPSSADVCLHSSASGTIFFAVSQRGAFARSLSMAFGAAFEVCVSTLSTATPKELLLCEAAEAAHGDRSITTRVFQRMGLGANDFHLQFTLTNIRC